RDQQSSRTRLGWFASVGAVRLWLVWYLKELDRAGARRALSQIDASSPGRRVSPNESQSGRCDPPPNRVSGVRPETPQYKPVLPSRSRESPSARRCASSGRVAAPAPSAATPPRRPAPL